MRYLQLNINRFVLLLFFASDKIAVKKDYNIAKN